MELHECHANYKAFGLTIKSEWYLPELLLNHDEDNNPDVVIRKKDLSYEWSQLATQGEVFIVKPNFVMFRIPDVAIYLIENGNELTVSPIENASEDQIRLYILGTCMGAILLQRKIIPLHGSAIAIDGKAYAFVGHSGAGKSTLASAFLKRGYRLLSDDVIPISFMQEEVPIVIPAYPQQKLWKTSLEQFGMSSDYLRPIVGRATKFSLPIHHKFNEKPLPLARVCELIKTDQDKIELQTVSHRLERLHLLIHHTYRNSFITQLGLLQWHFNMSTTLAHSLKMFQLHRPTNRFTADECVDLLLTNIQEKESVL